MRGAILHAGLNPGRIVMQRPGPVHPETRRMLRPRMARLLKRTPGRLMTWLGLPRSLFTFELTNKTAVHVPLFFGRWGGEQNPLAPCVVGTHHTADAGLWEVIPHLGRRERPRRPPSLARWSGGWHGPW